MNRFSVTVGMALLVCLSGCSSNEDRPARARSSLVRSASANVSARAAPVFGGHMVSGSLGEATVLLPVLATDAPSRDVARLIFNGLLKYDKDARLVGDLAHSWDVSDGGRTIRFHLKKDVLWQDGKPFTSADVDFTYRLYADPATPTAWASDYLKIEDLRAIGDHTIEVRYREPYSPALESWTEGMLPSHLLEGEVVTESPLQRNPVGTGPYKFDDWTTGERIELSANSSHFDGKPYISKVTIKTIPDTASMFLLLKSGRLDRMDLTPIQFQRQTDTEWFQRNFKKYKYLHWGYTYLGYNLRDPKFSDKRVRQALTMAINRERIVKCALMGLGRVAHTPYKPDTMWHNANVKKFRYDPARARKLLEEAGWVDVDGNGYREKDGRPFEFTIITNQGNELRKNAAVLIQRDLKDVGICVKVRVVEWAAMLKHFIHKRDFEACLLGWRIAVDPNQIDVWHSSKTAEHCMNFVGYTNPEVDALLEAGAASFEPKERKKSYDKFQEILAEDLPYTFLWVQEDLPIISSRIYGIRPGAIGLDYNSHQWHVPRDLQKWLIQP